jgi:hypothetical protein
VEFSTFGCELILIFDTNYSSVRLEGGVGKRGEMKRGEMKRG